MIDAMQLLTFIANRCQSLMPVRDVHFHEVITVCNESLTN